LTTIQRQLCGCFVFPEKGVTYSFRHNLPPGYPFELPILLELEAMYDTSDSYDPEPYPDILDWLHSRREQRRLQSDSNRVYDGESSQEKNGVEIPVNLSMESSSGNQGDKEKLENERCQSLQQSLEEELGSKRTERSLEMVSDGSNTGTPAKPCSASTSLEDNEPSIPFNINLTDDKVHAKTNTGAEIETMDDESPPRPFDSDFADAKFVDGEKSGAPAKPCSALTSLEDNEPPLPFNIDFTDDKEHAKTGTGAEIETMDDESPPRPFDSDFTDAKFVDGEKSTHTSKRVGKSSAPTNSQEFEPWPSKDMDTAANNYNAFHSSAPVFQVAEAASETLPAHQEHKEEEEVVAIPEAFLVIEEERVQIPFAEAELIRQSELVNPHRQSSVATCNSRLLSILIMALVIALAIAIGLSIKFKSDNKSASLLDTKPSIVQSSTPSLQPSNIQPSIQRSQSIEIDIEMNVLQRNASFDQMDPTDARVKALEWIIENDGLNLDAADQHLHQRYILALLHFELSFPMQSWLHECLWKGVSCDDYSNVIKLDLNKESETWAGGKLVYNVFHRTISMLWIILTPCLIFICIVSQLMITPCMGQYLQRLDASSLFRALIRA
jgi:hypothetical protein